jgi:hypothetical protein
MPCSHTWEIYLRDADTSIDITSSVLGFSLNQSVQIARVGSYNGYLHLDNNENIYTPSAGGTHASLDWFSMILDIRCIINDGSTSTTANVAHMIINDIDFQDDGQQARVMLTLADFFSYAARDQVKEIDITADYDTLDVVSQNILNGVGGITAVPFPKFDAASDTVTAINKKNNVPAGSETAPGFWGIIDEFDSGTAKDHLNAQVLPSGPAIIYPTTASFAGSTWTLNAGYINRLMTKESVSSTDHYRVFEFTADKTADKFPMQKVSTQYNLINTINQASVQAVYPVTGEPANVSNNTTSQDTLGVRSVTYSKVITWSFGGATQANKAVIGDFWVNRFSDVTYTPQQLSILLEAVDTQMDSSSRQNYADFLSVATGLWSVAAVTFTPKGASSPKTYNCVIAGRQIFATPNSTTISVDLLPAAENQSITLDKTNVGILDENRLG